MAAAQQVNPFSPDESLNTAVHHAAEGGNIEILHFFAQQAAVVRPRVTDIVDAPNDAGETPLIRAAHSGQVAAAKALVSFGCNLLHKDRNGNTPAHHAAHQGQLWALHYLLEAQSTDSDEILGGQCNMQRDILQWAIDGGHLLVIKYILERGYDPNVPDYEGRTALHHAILDENKPIIQLLLAYGAKSDTSDERGLTAISTATNLHRNTIINMILAPSLPPHTPYSKPYQTRFLVLLLYSVLWVGCLMLSFVVPWYAFFPLMVLAVFFSMKTMALSNHKHSKSHNAKKFATAISPSVPLHSAQQRGSVSGIQFTEQERRLLHQASKKAKSPCTSLPKKIWIWFTSQREVAIGLWFGWMLAFSSCLAYVMYRDYYSTISTQFDWWSSHLVFVYVLGTTQALCLIIWLLLSTGDAGHVDTSQDDMPKMLALAATGVAPIPAEYCQTCMVSKPIRSKHCAVCGVCVARMDHHCVWINKCVGYKNHRIFIAFLLTQVLTISMYLVVFWLYLLSKEAYLESLLKTSLPELVVIVWSILVILGLLNLLRTQLSGIANNLTVNESINWKRYPYLKSDGKTMSNPFNQGFSANVAEFFKHKVDYLKLHEAPTTSKVLHDENSATTVPPV